MSEKKRTIVVAVLWVPMFYLGAAIPALSELPADVFSPGPSITRAGAADAIAAAGEPWSLPDEPMASGDPPSGAVVGWGSQVVGVDLSGPFIALAAGGSHSLGLKPDGSIVAWGNNCCGQTNVPAPNTGFIAIAAGGSHSLGLKADGSIVSWGWNYFGQTNIPAPNTGFIAVAAGDYHSLGLVSPCRSFGDADTDCDVDLHDVATFSRCFTGASGGPLPSGCNAADFDVDIDLADFTLFTGSLIGP